MRTLAPSVLLILVACVGGTGTKDDPQDSEPEIVDTDGDGLSDKEEAALGTDPESEDTDGDGYDDLTESQDGDPLECMTVPSGEGNWANCKQKMSDDGLEGETWRDDGRVMMNFTITDQFGQEVELHQFYGQVVLLDFSAGWCGPCNTMAMGAEAI